ncbi:PEPxxWA-CTERM sorting domain-containing protein [Sphingomonas sp. BK235]|uniref:PEPxxWA-CTERM sorting domain-containing protein n=1 Tax=Sphingomonas sp. BK235 TaxID=2512131 RepID=UPI0010EF61A1|nr:PEPxxWA-CTERM sorting domain-containing protein [Sphingomonas sp. BK235]TCP29855.1 putative secreted protein with PEP-CTERM sorting signal [Sphingomonas sp. BK235]
MKKLWKAALAAVIFVCAPAHAEIVDYTMTGRVTGDRYPSGGPGYDPNTRAIDAFVAQYELGTPYALTFSYDTAFRSTNVYGRYATYADVPVAATMSIENELKALPLANLVVGYDTMFQRERFALFGNSIGAWTRNFSGFSLLNFSFEATSAEPIGPSLPANLSLAAHAANYARLGLYRDDVGFFSMLLSIDTLGRSTSAVPEPETWALMILGFGVVGASLRRRSMVTSRA